MARGCGGILFVEQVVVPVQPNIPEKERDDMIPSEPLVKLFILDGLPGV